MPFSFWIVVRWEFQPVSTQRHGKSRSFAYRSERNLSPARIIQRHSNV